MTLNPFLFGYVVEYNCYVASNDLILLHTLTEWVKDYKPAVFNLSEARTHYATIKQFCKDNGYTQFQLPPAPLVPSGRRDPKTGKEIMLVNEQGDEAVLVRNDLVQYVTKSKVVKMSKEWLVTGHNQWHTGRQYWVVVFKFPKQFTGGRKIKLRDRCSHFPTHGATGPNKVAWMESAMRSKAWMLLAPKAASIDVTDANENVTGVQQFYGSRFTVSGSGIDMMIARNVKKIVHKELDKGGSDHHGQLFEVWL